MLKVIRNHYFHFNITAKFLSLKVPVLQETMTVLNPKWPANVRFYFIDNFHYIPLLTNKTFQKSMMASIGPIISTHALPTSSIVITSYKSVPRLCWGVLNVWCMKCLLSFHNKCKQSKQCDPLVVLKLVSFKFYEI